MKLKLTPQFLHNIAIGLIFVGVIAIISYLLPNQDNFKYQYEVGKPWSYDLVTAAFDFPIYKSKEQLDKEQQVLLSNFSPYYKLDSAVMEAQYKRFNEDFSEEHGVYPDEKGFILKKWQEMYTSGIISNADLQKLKTDQVKEINCIMPNRKNRVVKVDELHSTQSAYDELMKHTGPILHAYNLNLYLVENLHYDSIISELSKEEMLKNLSLTSGIIQAGERIIDRGEIVSPEMSLVLSSLKTEYDKQKTSFHRSYLVVVGEVIIVAGLILLFFFYLSLFRPRLFHKPTHLIFINLLILMMITITSLVIQHSSASYFIVPFALLPIIVRVFFDSRTALFAHIITVLIASLMVDNAFQFLIIQISVGMTAVSSLKDMTQRSQLAQTALLILINYILIYLAIEFISEGDLSRVYWQPLIYFVISSAFLLFAYLLIYIFEKIFGLVSAITLLELTNVNSDLMMEFAEKAPGTFQHTLQVSNLATEAAKKIGANSLLVRTGALYHDIGKMKHPGNFTENQMGGRNPLKELSHVEAAKIIIRHVHDGIAMAKKAHLPEQIIRFISTHHGLSKTLYFYNSFINDNPGVKPDDAAFTYPGPLPDTKETAILMMADAVEARSRSLPIYTEQTINECVESMINGQIADGQFKDAPISFRDVETVKSIFKEKIRNMYHSRIVYPELNKETEI